MADSRACQPIPDCPGLKSSFNFTPTVWKRHLTSGTRVAGLLVVLSRISSGLLLQPALGLEYA